MSEVKSLLENLAFELKRPYTDLQPYVKILESNWYNSIEDLRAMQDNQMQRLGIPGRLITLIKQKIYNVQKPQNLKYESINTKNQNQSNLNISQLLDLLRKRIGQTEFMELTDILKKIFLNIQCHLTEEKYRRIKKGITLGRLYQHPEIIQVLKSGGFVEESNEIIMKNIDITRLNITVEQIQKNSMPKFDPYKANISSMTGLIGDLGSDSTTIYANKLQQLQKERQRLMSLPIKDRQIRIKKYNNQFEIKNQISFQENISNDDQQLFIRNIKQNIKKLEESSHFSSKRKAEYIALSKMPCFSQTLIRVRLPNNIIFQCKFSPLQTLGKLVEIFSSYIQQKNLSFYLYMTPPVQKIDKRNENTTFYDAGCVPRALFYFGSDQNIHSDIMHPLNY